MKKLVVKGVDLTELLGVPYETSRHPGNVSVEEFLANPERGANCQLFALGVLRKVGFDINDQMPMNQGERFGSKELWLDVKYTKLVVGVWCAREILWELFLKDKLRVYDIYFFVPPGVDFHDKDLSDDVLFKKFHTAIFTGYDFAGHAPGDEPQKALLHNAKPGPSALWSMGNFEERGYTLFGVKRPIRRAI